jgi:hypothetical protein
VTLQIGVRHQGGATVVSLARRHVDVPREDAMAATRAVMRTLREAVAEDEFGALTNDGVSPAGR